MDSSRSLMTEDAENRDTEGLPNSLDLGPYPAIQATLLPDPLAPSNQGRVEQGSWCFPFPAKRVQISGQVEVQSNQLHSLFSKLGLQSLQIPMATQHHTYQAVRNQGIQYSAAD